MQNSSDNSSGSSNMEKVRPLIQSFGRRRSHGLSRSQKEALQKLSENYGLVLPADRKNPSAFFEKESQIFVEIGFGAGEHLIQNAIQNPEVNFIGCEPFENGVAKVLKEISKNDLKNVRIYSGDARRLLNFFDDSSVDRFYVLFPDPWPKKRHHKRRLLSEEFVTTLLYSKLKVHGELVISTDCENYMEEIIEIFKKNADSFTLSSFELEQLRLRPSWFIPTRYEQKALSQGKRPFYLKAEKI